MASVDYSHASLEDALGDTSSKESEVKPSLFDLAHSRHSDSAKSPKANHTLAIEDENPISMGHLFKKPVVRQFLAGRVLAREGDGRETARFELFFDLTFVGIVHTLATQAINDESSWSMYKFITFFWLSWTVWQDARTYINTSGTDDIPQRIYVLLIMGILLGFNSNASAITVSCLTTSEPLTPGSYVLPGGCIMEAGWLPSLRGATGFFVVAKAIKVVLCMLYGWYLPRFRRAQYIRAASVLLLTVFFIPLFVLEKPVFFVILPSISIAGELFLPYLAAILVEVNDLHNKSKKPSDDEGGKQIRHFSGNLTPAISIEHNMDRTTCFVVLVIGEIIGNSTFTATAGQYGIHSEYLRCGLCLFIAYCLNWLYADMDASRVFMHALRRHWFSSITWGHLHFPFCAALLIGAGAMPKMILSNEADQRHRWLLGIGIGITTSCLALIGLLHKPLDNPHSALIPRNFRISARFAVALLTMLLPLAKLSSVCTLGIMACAFGILVAGETFGKLGSVGSAEELKKAFETRHLEDYDVHNELSELGVSPTEAFEDELGDNERGEDDVGVEGKLSNLQVTIVGPKQRIAYSF